MDTTHRAGSRRIRIWGALALITCLAATSVQLSIRSTQVSAAEPDIGPPPSAPCPAATPSPYPPRHDFCLRTNPYADVTVDKSAVGDAGTFTLTLALKVPDCITVVDVYPCVDAIEWAYGQTYGNMAYRLVTQSGTLFKDQFRYYQPFALDNTVPPACMLGTPRPSSAPTCTLQVQYTPAVGLVPPAYAVMMPAISVILAPSDPLAHRQTVILETVLRMLTEAVPNSPPMAAFTAERTAATSFSFHAGGSTDSDGSIVDYEWNWGDGNPVEHSPTSSANHTYAEAGTYPVTLTVTDNGGLIGSITQQVETAGTELIVNSGTDSVDDNLADKICSTGVNMPDGKPECTLRAALQTAQLAGGAPPKITFAIDNTGVPSLSPATLLPVMTRPIEIDGTSQSAGFVEINGGNMDGNGLDLVGPSVVRGMVINRFHGAAIRLSGGGSTIAGNRLGTDPTGVTALSNYSGVAMIGSSNNTVGGSAEVDGNIISGNTPPIDVALQAGVVMAGGGSGNKVIGNRLGVAADGSLLPNRTSVAIENSNANAIGGAGSQGNAIAAMDFGVIVTSGNNNTIEGNQIGLDGTGTTASPHPFGGVFVVGTSLNNTIANNVIAGHVLNVDLYGGSVQGTKVLDNHVGLNKAGTAVPAGTDCSANVYGIRVEGAPGTVVDHNQVAGHHVDVAVVGFTQISTAERADGTTCLSLGGPGATPGGKPVTGTDVTVTNNSVGLSAAGGEPAGMTSQSQLGIAVYGQSARVAVTGNTVGGHRDSDIRVFDGTDQTVSGNTVVAIAGHAPDTAPTGIRIDSGTTPTIDGNIISGHDATELSINHTVGAKASGNTIGSAGAGRKGIDLFFAADTTIGGLAASDANTVGNQSEVGIRIGGGSVKTAVLGNRVGTDPSGNIAAPNGTGIEVMAQSTDNRVDDNLVSGNTGTGIALRTSARLAGNRVGQRQAGGALPNDIGVHVFFGRIVLASNTIAHNTSRGLLIDSASGVTVSSGPIFENGDKQGIAYAGVPAVAPPKMVGAMRTRPEDGIVGVLVSVGEPGLPDGTFELYGNSDCTDPEGRIPMLRRDIKQNDVLVDVIEAATFQQLGNPAALTATFTDVDGNTSAFSNCVDVKTPEDSDSDGVIDLYEQSGPNDGDANHDGAPDAQQPTVATVKTDGGWVTFVSTSGTTLQNVGEHDRSNYQLPADVQLPYGLIGFDVQGLATGGTAVIDMLTPVLPTADQVYAKVLPDGAGSKVVTLPPSVDGSEGAERTAFGWRLHLVDGGQFDYDATANGRLRDPGGPAIFPVEVTVAPSTTATPTTTIAPATPNTSLSASNVVRTLPRTGSGGVPMVPAAVLVVLGAALLGATRHTRRRRTFD